DAAFARALVERLALELDVGLLDLALADAAGEHPDGLRDRVLALAGVLVRRHEAGIVAAERRRSRAVDVALLVALDRTRDLIGEIGPRRRVEARRANRLGLERGARRVELGTARLRDAALAALLVERLPLEREVRLLGVTLANARRELREVARDRVLALAGVLVR